MLNKPLDKRFELTDRDGLVARFTQKGSIITNGVNKWGQIHLKYLHKYS
jgi:hypothetical protein